MCSYHRIGSSCSPSERRSCDRGHCLVPVSRPWSLSFLQKHVLWLLLFLGKVQERHWLPSTPSHSTSACLCEFCWGDLEYSRRKSPTSTQLSLGSKGTSTHILVCHSGKKRLIFFPRIKWKNTPTIKTTHSSPFSNGKSWCILSTHASCFYLKVHPLLFCD